MAFEKKDLSKIVQIWVEFSRLESVIRKPYAAPSNLSFVPIIRDERLITVAYSAYQSLKERSLADSNKKVRVVKDYIPGDRELGCVLESERLRWIAEKALTLMTELGQIEPTEKTSLLEKIDASIKAIRQASAPQIEAYFELYKLKAVNPEIDQIERAKIAIENAMKANDQRALMELKLKNGALLKKEHLYARRLSSINEGVWKTEDRVYPVYWELETILHNLLDRYSQFLFTILQSLLAQIPSSDHQTSIVSLVTENEEIQRQTCMLHDRTRKRSDVLETRVQMLRDSSGKMSLIINQQHTMNEYMQNRILDLCKSYKSA